MKKTIFILAALALIFASCSNSAGGGSDSNGHASTGTDDGATNGGSGEQQESGDNQNERLQGIDFIAEDYKYTLSAGQTVQIASVMNESYAIIRVESLNESVVKAHSEGGKFFMTGISAGTAVVKAIYRWNGLEDPTKYYWRCDVTVTSTSPGGQSQSSLESFLTGTWTNSEPNYQSSGTLVLNANKTGHITTYLRGDLLHNKDFTWRAYETRDARNQPVKVLEISGTNEGALDNTHIITTAANSFTLNGNFAFGMSNRTVWTKQ